MSITAHAIGLALLIFFTATGRHASGPADATDTPMYMPLLDRPGPAGGGGNGGAARPEPPRAAQAPRTGESIQSVAKPIDVPQIAAVASTAPIVPGVVAAIDITSPVVSGNGTTGPGSGQGRGQGLDEGRNRGVGGDLYVDGSTGVTSPEVIKEIRPNYTAEAMRAKVQGRVLLEAVVLPNGTIDPASLRVTQSLDSVFGLDREAMAAVKSWRFKPGTYRGRPAAVLVTIELLFSLR